MSEMSEEQRLGIAMEAVRDQLNAVIIDHEDREHGGEPCYDERFNAVAFLAHCLGATRQDLIVMEQLLVRYDLNCQCEFCAPRNAPPKPLTEGKDHAPPIHAQP